MKKINAILYHLSCQIKYETIIFWSINSLVIIGFSLLALFVPSSIGFTITPSGAIYVLVAIVGSKWISRSLSYLLRLGVNRKQYAIGSILFTILYNAVHSTIALIFFGLYHILKIFELGSTLYFLHPAHLLVSDLSAVPDTTPAYWQIFLTDFLLLNSLMLICMLFSIIFHRFGKLGGYTGIAILSFLFVVSIPFQWLFKLFDLVRNENFIITGLYLLMTIFVLATIYIMSLRKISITSSQK